MRQIILILPALVLASVGHAAEGNRGEAGGKGGNPPGVGPSIAADSSVAHADTSSSATTRYDPSTGQWVSTRAWGIGAGWETHRLIRQEDLEGSGADKLVNYLMVFARYDVTANDQLQLRFGAFERFLADPQESGIRADDLALYYNHSIQLPARLTLILGGILTAPTSFDSWRRGVISTPSIGALLAKSFGPLHMSASTRFTYNWVKYREVADGSSPNPLASLSAGVESELEMPFHPALSVGLHLATKYVWYYDVGSSHGASIAPGVVGDPQFPNQPMQQSYGGQFYARYRLPEINGLLSDFTAGYAQGDATLGYGPLLHDGVGHFYFLWRQTSQIYAAVTLQY